MTAALLNLTIEQGADFEQVFPITDPEITSQELSGATAVMQFRTQFGDPTAQLTLTTLNGGLVIDGANRAIAASIGWATTEAMLAGTGVCDVKLLTASGKHKRTHQGPFAVSPAVTLAEPPALFSDEYGNADGDTYGNANGDTYGRV